jgi:hypothetical protein
VEAALACSQRRPARAADWWAGCEPWARLPKVTVECRGCVWGLSAASSGECGGEPQASELAAHGCLSACGLSLRHHGSRRCSHDALWHADSERDRSAMRAHSVSASAISLSFLPHPPRRALHPPPRASARTCRATSRTASLPAAGLSSPPALHRAAGRLPPHAAGRARRPRAL